MPSSVRSIFAAAELEPDGSVSWGEPIPAPESGPTTGVYAIAVTADVGARDNPHPICPRSENALNALLTARPELRLDGERPDPESLADRLAAFWLRDAPVLYIGLAGPRRSAARPEELSDRVAEYYATPLGARSPHAGGWPLKALSILDDLVVHYAYSSDVAGAERAMLKAFAAAVSPTAATDIHDPDHVMPFANLEHPPGVRKGHGISGATEPRRRKRSRGDGTGSRVARLEVGPAHQRAA
ncbi:MAG: hypothetical protein BroJett022_21400 [Actinomycetes bacterium]|nr:MAG: hypothetical protein BroJett022_21400 [Actinomycetes bacterium]